MKSSELFAQEQKRLCTFLLSSLPGLTVFVPSILCEVFHRHKFIIQCFPDLSDFSLCPCRGSKAV